MVNAIVSLGMCYRGKSTPDAAVILWHKMFPIEQAGNSLTMTILQELWCDTLRNDVPLGAMWV